MAEERPKRTTEPHDRLTTIANDVGQAYRQHPLREEGDRCIVLMYDPERAGVGLFDYEDDTAAVVDMFIHLRAIVRAQGKDLEFIGIPNSPEGLT